MNTDFFSSIKFKILGSLFLVLAGSISIGLYGMWTYERDKLIDMTHQEAVRAGLAIKAGLRHAMLENDKAIIEKNIVETAQVTMLSRISILSNNGLVAVSSEPALTGTVLDRNRDETCTVCHVTEEIKPEKNITVIEINDQPILRNIIKIANEPACHECHPATHKTLGVLVFDSSLADVYALLNTTAKRIVYTGGVTFLVIIILLISIVSRYITSPIQRLINGLRGVGDGDFDVWVDIESSREFNDMATSFNVMSRAIRRYIDEVQEKGREIKTLYTIVQRMSRSIEWNRVKKVVVVLLSEVLETPNVTLIVPIEARPDHFEVCWKNENDRRLFCQDYSLAGDSPPHESVTKEEMDAWLQFKNSAPVFADNDCKALIPLWQEGRPLGLICAVRRAGQNFSLADKEFIPALSNHIAIAFTNARLYSMAITDSLTGLYTKRHLTAKLEEMVELYNRTKSECFFLLMLDLDHFKEVNDTYGHPVGDQVLSQIAWVIRKTVRRNDTPCRFGGEEFAVMLPGGDLDSATRTAERIRERVAAHVFEAEDFPAFQKTISIGLAGCPSHGTTVAEVVKAADDALYRAKNGGRNQVCVAL